MYFGHSLVQGHVSDPNNKVNTLPGFYASQTQTIPMITFLPLKSIKEMDSAHVHLKVRKVRFRGTRFFFCAHTTLESNAETKIRFPANIRVRQFSPHSGVQYGQINENPFKVR